MDQVIYFSALILFFALNLRIIRALHFENKFEKFKIWEIKAAIFLVSLGLAHLLAEMVVRFSELLENMM